MCDRLSAAPPRFGRGVVQSLAEHLDETRSEYATKNSVPKCGKSATLQKLCANVHMAIRRDAMASWQVTQLDIQDLGEEWMRKQAIH